MFFQVLFKKRKSILLPNMWWQCVPVFQWQCVKRGHFSLTFNHKLYYIFNGFCDVTNSIWILEMWPGVVFQHSALSCGASLWVVLQFQFQFDPECSHVWYMSLWLGKPFLALPSLNKLIWCDLDFAGGTLFFSSPKHLASVSYARMFYAVFIDFPNKGFSNPVAFYSRKMQNNLLSLKNFPFDAFDGLINLKEL